MILRFSYTTGILQPYYGSRLYRPNNLCYRQLRRSDIYRQHPLIGSTTGVWPTMLQAAKRGASSLPLLPLTNPLTEKYYFHSLPRVALLSHTSPPPILILPLRQPIHIIASQPNAPVLIIPFTALFPASRHKLMLLHRHLPPTITLVNSQLRHKIFRQLLIYY